MPSYSDFLFGLRLVNELQLDALTATYSLLDARRGAAADLLHLSHKMKQAIVATLDGSDGLDRRLVETQQMQSADDRSQDE